MKKLLLVSSLVVFLVSCKEISGTLSVGQNFSANVVNKCGFRPFKPCPSTKTVDIPVGSYKSVVNFGSKTEIKIEIKANAFKETIILKRPKNFEFPKNGSYGLTKEQVQQNFDVAGNVSTTVTESEMRRENESCTYTVPDWVCTPDSNGVPSCHPENRTVWGFRYVEFFNRYTTTDLYADLVDGSTTYARFNGRDAQTDKIYIYTGICR